MEDVDILIEMINGIMDSFNSLNDLEQSRRDFELSQIVDTIPNDPWHYDDSIELPPRTPI